MNSLFWKLINFILKLNGETVEKPLILWYILVGLQDEKSSDTQQFTGMENDRDLWLKLFKVETEEELVIFENMEEPIMNDAVKAYRRVSASQKLKNIERAMSKAGHDEAQAIKNAELRGEKRGEERGEKRGEAKAYAKMQTVLNEKDAEIARLASLVTELQSNNN